MNAIEFDIPRIETDRLRFRMLTIDDLDAEAEFYASERSAGVGGPKERREVFRMLAGVIGHWVMRGYGFYAIDDKETGRYCGRCGLWFPLEWPEPEIGWSVMAHAEGKGIAREAAIAVRDHAYIQMGWTTMISLIAPDNDRSKKLAERLGAQFETIYEHPVYGGVEQWRHPSAAALAGEAA